MEIEDNKAVSGIMRFGAVVAVLVGAGLTFSLFYKINGINLKSTSDSVITISIGLIGPLFSLGGFFLLYLTLQSQRENFQKERFENNLFEMIKSNRQIVSEMEYEVPDDDEPRVVKGHKIFVRIEKHFKEAYNDCSIFFDKYDKVENDYFIDGSKRTKEYNLLKSYLGNELTDEMFRKIIRVNMIYLCIFYGVSKNGKEILSKDFEQVYKPSLYNEIITKLQNKIADWDIRSSRRIKIKYYGGHQIRLGHYFRNYFAIINYVNKQDFIDYNQKLDYVKHLRSQTSTYEQFTFFLNSLCSLGRIWEIEAEKNNEVGSTIDKRLITKYNLIKNLPEGFFPLLEPSKIYKLVHFELKDVDDEKKKILDKYQ